MVSPALNTHTRESPSNPPEATLHFSGTAHLGLVEVDGDLQVVLLAVAGGGGRGGGPGGGLGVQVQRGQLLDQLVQAALLLVDDEQVVGQGGEEGLPPGDHHVPEGDDGVGSVIHSVHVERRMNARASITSPLVRTVSTLPGLKVQ